MRLRIEAHKSFYQEEFSHTELEQQQVNQNQLQAQDDVDVKSQIKICKSHQLTQRKSNIMSTYSMQLSRLFVLVVVLALFICKYICSFI